MKLSGTGVPGATIVGPRPLVSRTLRAPKPKEMSVSSTSRCAPSTVSESVPPDAPSTSAGRAASSPFSSIPSAEASEIVPAGATPCTVSTTFPLRLERTTSSSCATPETSMTEPGAVTM